MPKDSRSASALPSIHEFAARFRRAYGREMTGEEQHFLQLASLMLDENLGVEQPDEVGKGAAA